MPSTTRQALLQALSAAGGAYISGQQLAGQLGVSRAAVHKAAAALTAQGYALEAVSRRGYRLLGGDPFCAEAVGPYPAPVQVYDTLESSNRTAKLLALEGAPPGLEPEQQVLDTLGAEELTRMILDLREPYKTPCRLVLLEQHTMAEAARLCGRPEKTVNAQIYRAKKMLVQQIREQQEGRSVHGTV